MDSKQEDITQPIGKQLPQEESNQSTITNVEGESEQQGPDETISPFLERIREKAINPPEFNPENITEQDVEEGEEAQGVGHSMLDTIRDTYSQKKHDLLESAAGVKESVEHTITERFHRLSETAANVEDYIIETLTGGEQVDIKDAEGLEDVGESIDNPEGQKEEQGILGTIRHWIMPDTAETPETLDKPADYGKSDAEIAKESNKSAKDETSDIKDTVMEKGHEFKEKDKDAMSKGVESAEETAGSKARGKLSKKSTEPFEKTHDEGKDQAKGLKEFTDDTSPGITEAWREMKEASKQPGLDITGEKKDEKGVLKALHDWVITPGGETKEYEPTEMESGETTGKREIGAPSDLYGQLTSESLQGTRTERNE